MARDQASGGRRDGPYVLSVTELTRDVKLVIERNYTGVWVEGELSNLRRHAGHYYFTLKDAQTQIRCVMFSSANRRLRFRPDDGMSVLVWGPLTVYEPQGNYQILVKRMEPRGQGALHLAFEQLKEKLSSEGLFDPDRKKPLPLLPRRLGVVTSPAGAAIRDICRVLHRRFENLDVLVYPAQVQGSLAASQIARGVRVLNRVGDVDTIIVTRGGGSLEDLWPFNEEIVARAIARSEVPVMSAVGHEIDYTISDMVADVRAPTPSAAAEMVVESKDRFRERVSGLARRLEHALGSRLQELRGRVDGLAEHRGFVALRYGIDHRRQRVDELSLRSTYVLERSLSERRAAVERALTRVRALGPQERLRRAALRHADLRARLEAAWRSTATGSRRRLGEVAAKLHALSPVAVLGRGYSLAWTQQGKLLRRASDTAPGEELRVRLDEGELDCRVERIRDE